MRVVSLFSGAGGLDLGFVWAGHEVVWANDNFSDAVNTYRRNIGPHILERDISDVDSSDIPESDIVIGGFPCQGFSVANSKRHVSDSRNLLYLQMLRVITDKKPMFFLAENVKGIVSLGRGRVLEMIINDFEQAGYRVNNWLLNAADFGVPQIRERVFFVGVRADLSVKIEPPHKTHSPIVDEAKNGLKPWISVAEALKSIPNPDGKHDLENHTYSKYKLRFNGYLGHRRVDPNKPAPTVTARGDDKGGVVVLHHPSNTRRMSARELATVQSFPLAYVFSGCRSSVYRQIANAVPPLLAAAVAASFTRETTKGS